MKFKILLLFSAAAFIFSLSSVKNALPGIRNFMAEQDTMEEKQAELDSLKSSLSDAISLAGGQELGKFDENLEIAQEISTFDGCSVSGIYALRTAGSPLEDAVITITDLQEVTYFTETINEMAFYLNISDVGKAFKALTGSGIHFTAADYQADSGILILRVPTVTAGSTDSFTGGAIYPETGGEETEGAEITGQPETEEKSAVGGIVKTGIEQIILKNPFTSKMQSEIEVGVSEEVEE